MTIATLQADLTGTWTYKGEIAIALPFGLRLAKGDTVYVRRDGDGYTVIKQTGFLLLGFHTDRAAILNYFRRVAEKMDTKATVTPINKNVLE